MTASDKTKDGGSSTPMLRQGRLPFGDAQTLDDAVFCLRYILGQIEGCRTYRPNIGQVSSATSGLRLAIAELERLPTGDA
jgi:hypothetical protein